MKSHLYLALLKVHLENLRAYKADFIVGLAAAPIQFAFVVAFWSYTYGTFVQLTDIPPLQVTISYYALLIVYDKAISSLDVSERLTNDLFTGKVDVLLSRPIHPLASYAIEAYAGYLTFVPMSIFTYLLIASIYGLGPSIGGVVVASAILFLSSFTRFLISCLIGMWTTQIMGALRIYWFIEAVFSGAFIPLYFYPDFLKGIVSIPPSNTSRTSR